MHFGLEVPIIQRIIFIDIVQVDIFISAGFRSGKRTRKSWLILILVGPTETILFIVDHIYQAMTP